MAKILLLDFSAEDLRFLREKHYDVEAGETPWLTGKDEPLIPPLGCQIVFFQLQTDAPDNEVFADEGESFDQIIRNGGVVACFIGKCQEFHLRRIVGPVPRLKFGDDSLPQDIHEAADSPMNLIFRRFGSSLRHAFELLPLELSGGESFDPKKPAVGPEGEVHVLAVNSQRHPVALMVRRGKGFLILLPWFERKNIEAAELLLKDILPFYAPHLFENGNHLWMESYEYYFPTLKDILRQVEEETQRYRRTISRLREQIEEIKKAEQQPFNRLLHTEGKELKEAVIHALKYLGWRSVVDVDDYWKRTIRIKEEDLWLLDNEEQASVEACLRKNQMVLVVLRNGPGVSPDTDFLVLQKYKGRRMQEFDNTKMKALLLGNYFFQEEPRTRPNPFTSAQVEEAVNDGNGLLTTYDLFKAIKAEKENRLSKEDIRSRIMNQPGLIIFDI